MRKQFLYLLVTGILCACTSEDTDPSYIIDMRINHYQNTGVGEGLFLTLLIQEGDNIGTDNWSKFYSPIDGFTYESGRIYDLSVLVEPIDHPPADGASSKYTLQEIKATQEVDSETLFNVDLKTDGQSFITTTSGFELLQQIKIDCTTLCDDLQIRLQNQNFVIGTFKRINSKEIQLITLN
ncbi:hypothetical protein GCM10022393_41370 [Aquimarina addita]|uniref:DUF4377 domain-containing protein n=1 Tax=Aquimarina addita TaxID=870485 RepID=A0ABP6UU09_9FLAO